MDERTEARIIGYFKRAKKDKDLPCPPLLEVGTFEIISGAQGDYGTRHQIAVVRGRFIDVIEYAYRQSYFCGWYCSWEHTTDKGKTITHYDNGNHGEIKQFKVKELESLKINTITNTLKKALRTK